MEENGDQATTERLWADDEKAAERILAIDLAAFDELVTYPPGIDWDLERRKILFLQTALRIGYPWKVVVQLTARYFGQTLRSGPAPSVEPLTPQAFVPPAFDIARHTVESWTQEAEEAWQEHRVAIVSKVTEFRQSLLDSGALVEVRRTHRQSSGIKGQDKSPIMTEKEAFLGTVAYFFQSHLGNPISWKSMAGHLSTA